jgi:hypothetical protein
MAVEAVPLFQHLAYGDATPGIEFAPSVWEQLACTLFICLIVGVFDFLHFRKLISRYVPLLRRDLCLYHIRLPQWKSNESALFAMVNGLD